jgi:hypothetical protein
MQSIIKNISKSTGIDIRVVTQVVHHPFKFVRDKVSGNEERPIRIRYFGVFSQKLLLNKQSSTKRKVERILRWSTDNLAIYLNLSEEEAINHLNKLLEDKKYRDIDLIYKKVMRRYL